VKYVEPHAGHLRRLASNEDTPRTSPQPTDHKGNLKLQQAIPIGLPGGEVTLTENATGGDSGADAASTLGMSR
jgi:hypothetical protein